MNTDRDWERPVRRLEQLLRLRSFPVALRLLERREELGEIPYIRRPSGKVTLCQLITQVRTFDWTVGADRDDFISPICPSVIGLAHLPEFVRDGTFRSIVWTRTRQDGKKYEEAIPRIPPGRYEAVALAPLVYNPFDPHMILIYANPAQMILIINALQFEDYEVMRFFCVGETSCADALARCHLDGKPSLTIPCYGERRYGHTQDDELVMALPPSDLERVLRGLEALYRRGVRYPISHAGAVLDPTDAFPPSYKGLSHLELIRGKDNRLLIGLTGGIASGKSTVAKMLEEMGAPVIDFDVLSRAVVEPERPAWKEIVGYFGEGILLEDRTLDRKRLSQIVFRDPEKRKKLEAIIHPRVNEEFIRLLEEHTRRDPNAIILGVVPLLFEVNLQPLFHKVLLVYVPPEVQIQRLMERDGISREMAERILQAQWPIDEKRPYADFVIDNTGPLEETRRQVEKLWENILDLQRRRMEEREKSGCR